MLCFEKFGWELKSKYVLMYVYNQLQWERSERESIPRSTFSQTHSSASEPAAAQGGGTLHAQLQKGHLAIRTAKTGTVLGTEL